MLSGKQEAGMADEPWEIWIFKSDEAGSPPYAVVTSWPKKPDDDPTVEYAESRDDAERQKRSMHERLWRAKNKMFD